MATPDQLRRESEALRDRISRLSSAVLRISASLDVTTVLNEVVESACMLTGARYGAITTIDDAGQVQEFATYGITPDQHQQLLAWPYGTQLFEHLRDLPGPVLGDLPAYLRSLGYSSADAIPSTTVLGTQMRHRGNHVGGFFLGAKQGAREFTGEDEDSRRPNWPTCRSSSSPATAGTRRSPRPSRSEPSTTSSSPSRRRS